MERESRPPHTLPPLPPDVIDTEIAYLTERRRLVFGEPREHAPTGSPPASPPADAAPAGADRAASDDHTRALGELFKGAHTFKSFGLALSGGGIRSATFNLGLLQGLAEHGLLKYVDYLSTVSGGGYIGSWLHGVIKNRHGGDPERASRSLSPTSHPVPGAADQDPVSFLRKYSNYLAPRPGLFTADSWVIALIWIRNVLLNQLILLPTVAAVVLLALIGGFVAQARPGAARVTPAGGAPGEPMTAVLAVAAMAALLLLLGAVVIAAKNLRAVVRQSFAPSAERFRKTPGEERAERASLWIVPLVFAAAILIGWVLLDARRAPFEGPSAGAPRAWLHLSSLDGYRLLLAVMAVGTVGLLGLFQFRGGFVDGFASRHPNRAGRIGLLTVLHAAWMVPVTAAVTTGLLAGSAGVLGSEAVGRHFDAAMPWITVALTPPLVCVSFIVGIGLLVGLMGADYPDAAREWIARIGSMIALLCAAWLALFVIAVFGPWGVAALVTNYTATGVTALVAWAATTAGGVLAGRSARTEGKDAERPSRTLGLLIAVAPTVFMIGYLLLVASALHATLQWTSGAAATVSEATPPAARTYDVDVATPEGSSKVRVDVRPEPAPGWITRALRPVSAFEQRYWNGLEFGSAAGGAVARLFGWSANWAKPLALLAWLAGCLAVAVVASTRININEFSMHHLYKNRLVRCYLGASNGNRRDPNPLTGFDPSDEFRLATLVPRSDPTTGAPPYLGPYPIVNAALNLNAGSELAQQERKAASFVFTPAFCGFTPSGSRADQQRVRLSEGEFQVGGYRPTPGYSHPAGPYMGTTAAISGAAANPNSGYHTSGPMAFLLTVFDARLGWWLGNPRWRSPSQYPGPVFAWTYLFAELLGQTTGRSRFVNLSDGGHFDNLGLYELVRRRCRYVVVGDAEEDPKLAFESLGGAIRKCRADFGVEIDIDPDPIRAVNGRSAAHCVMGTIRYPEAEPGSDGQPATPARGYLFYLKASVSGDEPSDVTEYHTRFPEFPHQSTANQFFSESQFESYRRLGLHVARSAFEGIALTEPGAPAALADTFQALWEKWYPAVPVTAEAASRLADAYTALMRSISATPELAALAHELTGRGATLDPEHALPERAEPAFAAALEAIQLMQNVYTEFQLDRPANLANPRNRGWVMLFGRWLQSGILYEHVWRTVCQDYNPLFRAFVEDLHERREPPREPPPRP